MTKDFPQPPRASMPWWYGLPYSLLILVMLASGERQRGALLESENLDYAAGYAFSALLVGYAVAWLVWRHRQNKKP